MNFSEKLKILRIEANLTQDELAKKLFVTRQAVSNYEQGKGYPSIDTLLSISNLFNVSLDELLSSTAIEKFKRYTLILFCQLAMSIFIVMLGAYNVSLNVNADIWTVILMCCLFIIPLLSCILSVVFQFFPPKYINYLYGYRTKLSMKNQTMWHYAQAKCSIAFYISSLITLPLTDIVFIIITFIPLSYFHIAFLCVVIVQTAELILPVVYVESKLRKFGK